MSREELRWSVAVMVLIKNKQKNPTEKQQKTNKKDNKTTLHGHLP